MNLLTKSPDHQSMLRNLPNITFLAEALDDPFTDIRIVTLRSWVDTKVQHDALWLNKIEPTFEAKQFIRVDPNEIVIAIDADKVDDQAISDALLMLMETDCKGYCEFGESIIYNCDEFIHDTDIN